ncbi:DUF6934 family protein [uncultured Hymenobacter sp.]|uniref:DUF6934 family protein n=1 Tax=uncultured Hymenobacter sp. TaxID=170016 RepID=UPI0035CAF385
MDKPFYSFQRLGPNALYFEFVSEGPNPVRKLVLYSQTDVADLYSLSLADVNEYGQPDFLSVSNNGDLEQIMATVAQTMLAFFAEHPTATVAFTGSTPARTRLYQVVLAREVRAASTNFIILGLHGTDLEPFVPNRTYDGFVVRLPLVTPTP